MMTKPFYSLFSRSQICQGIAVLFLLSSIIPTSFSQESNESDTKYVIQNINYDIKGTVLEVAVRNKVELQTGVEFTSLYALLAYVSEKRDVLLSQRVLRNSLSTITFTYEWNESLEQYDVQLYVYVTTVQNILILPYPKYSTDGGVSMTGRFRNYNFLGTLDTLSINLDYNLKENSAGVFENRLSTSFGLSYPWAFGKHSLTLGLSERLEYRFYDSLFKNSTGTKLDYSYPLAQRISYGASIAVEELSLFESNEDNNRNYHYLENSVTPFSLGIQLTKNPIKNIGNIGYNVSLRYRQDVPLASFYAGDSDPNETRLNGYPGASQSIGFGSISNLPQSYFSQGFKFSLSNGYQYDIREGLASDNENIHLNEGWSMNVSMESRQHIPLWNRVNINIREYAIQNLYFPSPERDITGAGSSLDGRLRGVLSGAFGGAWRGAAINSDIMVNLFQLRVTRIFSAEFHGGLLLDIAIRQPATVPFNADEDIAVTTGFEGIAYNLNYNGIRIRASYGFDLLKTLRDNEAGHSSIPGGIWRNREILIGTELFY